MRGSRIALLLLAAIFPGDAQIMSVDLGHEFFKVALMRQSAPLEIVLNSHSKRKTTTAVSFFEAIRTFGDDALAHQGKAPNKVPMFFHSTLGRNYTADDVKPGGRWWVDFGLGDRFYSHSVGYSAERGVPTFKVGDDVLEGEELLASIFYFAKQMADGSGDGTPINVKDLAVTIPPDATLRQRQAIVAAGEIAGMRVQTLVHEGSAFAVHRAVDYSPEQGDVEYALYYNLGSRKAEVSIVRLEARSAGMVKGKTAPVVSVVGSAIDFRIGGHLMDLKLAEFMLERFQEKNPKLADGIATNSRALRKLLSQAQKTKAVLSANTRAPFIVESLYEDTDFMTQITRSEFEIMCQDIFDVLTEPISKAMEEANVTFADLKHVEVVGGAWRAPKVQQVLSDYLEKEKGSKLPLGQHLNGEEAAAMGTALIAANSSSSFRVRKIFFSDVTRQTYSVQVASINNEWERNITVFYAAGNPLGSKKKVSLELSEDFVVRLFENGNLITEWTVTGLEEILEGKWKDYNMTGSPKITATIPLDSSGLIELKTPTASVEESHWVNVSTPKLKPNVTVDSKNDSNDEISPENSSEETATTDEGASASAEDGENATDENATDENATDENASANATEEVEYEITQKLKKKKHEKKLKVSRKEFTPHPLTQTQIADLKKKLQGMADHEAEVRAISGVKNELEATIYSSRDQMEREDIEQVTTEEQRQEVTKMATELEEWMYESGLTKSDYENKLKGLQDLLAPMEERAREMEARSSLADSVKEQLEEMAKSLETVSNMAWVNVTKSEAAKQKQEDFETWWAKKQELQEKLPLHEAPAYTANEVSDKIGKVQKEWEKLKKTKKPKEKKAPKKANDTKAEKDTASKEAPLPVDVAATKKQLEEISTKKMDAVEKEDFDTAEVLKQREQALKAHLANLEAGDEAKPEKQEL